MILNFLSIDIQEERRTVSCPNIQSDRRHISANERWVLLFGQVVLGGWLHSNI